MVNNQKFSFLGFLEEMGIINAAANHPAARLTKSSERIIKTRFTKIMIS